MKTRHTLLPLLFVLFSSALLRAQPGSDGDMRIDLRFEEAWNEDRSRDFEIIPFELNIDIGTRDFPDIDGVSWDNSGIISYNNSNALFGPYTSNISDYNKSYIYGSFNTLGPNPAPLGIQMQYDGWEKDCYDCFRCTGTFFGVCISWSCDQCSRSINYTGGCPCSGNILCNFGCNADERLAQGQHTGSNRYGFRNFPPQSFGPQVLVRTNAGGVSSSDGTYDLGAFVRSRWTSPCPNTLTANRTVLCEPDFVTLFTGGAVFGGDYVWYYSTDGFITQDSIVTSNVDSTLTIFLAQNTTFRVHTRNGPDRGFNSWSYREIDIIIDRPTITDINVVEPLCFGSNDGEIEILATGGTPPLEYTIDNFATTQPSNTFPVGGGFYIANVQDVNGCTADDLGATITLVEPADISINVVNVDDVDCNGASNGRIDVSVTGGVPPYVYEWRDGGGGLVGTNEDLLSVGPGTYDLVVTDQNNCTETATATIAEPPALTTAVVGDSVTCAGDADGFADLTVGGGTPPYTFLWSNGFGTEDVSNLAGGTYVVQVTDANGCVAVDNYTVFEPAPLDVSFVVTDVLCNGGADGAIDLTVTGGNGGYDFSWSDGTTVFASTEDLTGLSGGTYFVTVTDRKNCTATETITVNEPAQNTAISTTAVDVSCFGASDGSIDLSVLGGTPPYTYAWEQGGTPVATTQDLIDISGGTYAVTITDDNGCQDSTSVTILEPAAPLGVLGDSIAITDVLCFDDADGVASVVATGGTPPYDYLWSTFDTAATATGLTPGAISVIVTDANGCDYFIRDTVRGPDEDLVITLDSLFNIACAGGDEGAIYTTVSGGTPPYTITWIPSTGSSTEDATNLAAGSYVLDISDSQGCKTARTFEVTEPDSLESSVAVTEPDCPDEQTGQALVGVNGGVAPYSYEWSTVPPQLGVLANGLTGDSTLYFVTITDANDCVIIDSAFVDDPEPMQVTTVPTEVSCFSGSNGEVAVSVTGGTPPYRYELNGFLQDDSIFTGLTAGNYQVVVEDNKGCVAIAGFSINPVSELLVELTSDPDGLVVRAQDVVLQTQLQNTTPSTTVIDYIWTASDGTDLSACDGSPSCLVNPEQETTYQVATYEAVAGDTCVILTELTIEVSQETIPFIPSAFSPNGDGVNDCFAMNVLGAERLDVKVFNRWGEDIYHNPDQQNGPTGPDQTTTLDALDTYCQTSGDAWDGTYQGEPVPAGAYVYQVAVTYFDGTSEVINGTVSVVR